MEKQKGNVVVIILLAVVVLSIFFLVNLKSKSSPKKVDNTPPTSKIKAMDEKIKNHIDSKAPIILNQDEVLNPFSTDSSTQVIYTNSQLESPPTGTTTKKKSSTGESDLPSVMNNHKALPNKTTFMPNGKNLPLHDGFVDYYSKKFNHGNLNITVNNIENKSNLLVYIYHLRPLNVSETLNDPSLAAVTYISAGNSFRIPNLQSGNYQLKWVTLSNNKAFENNAFTLSQDNKYLYDKVFTFKETSENTKLKSKEIPLKSLE